MAKKRISKKKLEQQKKLHKRICTTIFLCLLVIGLSFLIIKTDILSPKIDEATASYISFNNKNSTDMLKISNLYKMGDTIGQSIINSNYVKFNVEGEPNYRYEILIDTITNSIDEKYIKYSFSIGNKVIVSTLDKLDINEDSEKILYKGEVNKNDKITIHMWISKEYRKNIDNTSFEIKIKPR